MEVDGVVTNAEALARIVAWAKHASGGQGNLDVRRIVVRNAKIAVKGFDAPAFDADVLLSHDAQYRGGSVKLTDGTLKAELTPTDEGIGIEATGKSFKLPMGPPVVFDDLVAKGIATKDGITLSEIEGLMYGGIGEGQREDDLDDRLGPRERIRDRPRRALSRSWKRSRRTRSPAVSSTRRRRWRWPARPWARSWTTRRRRRTSRCARARSTASTWCGRCRRRHARASVAARAASTSSPATSSLAGGRYQYRNLRLQSGLLVANGQFDVLPNQDVTGRAQVELKSTSNQFRGNFAILGTLKAMMLKP